jgi:CrcB protein
MRLVWFVATGGAVGSATRFALTSLVQQRWGAAGGMPIGTLVINVSGSLLVGFLLRYSLGNAAVSPDARALVVTGFCGGYTTFSAFSFEAMSLIESGDYRRAAVYVCASVLLSLVAVFAGAMGARAVLASGHGT